MGDNDPEGLFAYSNEVLDSAVQTAFRMGAAPQGYSLSTDKTQISPDVPDGTAFAKIACETALMLISGEETVSYSTRPLTVRRKGDRIFNLITELRMRLSEGDGFETYQTFAAWLVSYTGPGELTQMQVQAPFHSVSLSMDGENRSISQ